MVGDAPVRASQVDPAATFDTLSKRLGAYEPEQESKPDPVRPTDILRIIRNATTWHGMHASLANVHGTYERKGSGAVVRTTNGTTWKASEISRAATLRRLEDRLGAFEPAGTAPAERAPNAKPTPTAPDPTSAAAIIDDAKSWHELHLELNYGGMTFEPKGSGAIVRAGDTTWKASQVSRRATLAQLERRFGPFEPAAHLYPTGPGARQRTEYERDQAQAIDDQRRDTQAKRDQHDAEITRIDQRAADDRDEIAHLFPRPSPSPAPANPRDKEKPSPPDDDAARAAAAQAREDRIVHDAMTLAFARKARRERARENRRYRRVLREIRRRYERATTYFSWLVDRGHLAPARGWDQPEPDAVLRPAPGANRAAPRPPAPQNIPGHTVCPVGLRTDYRDEADDLACADLGTHLIVRRPSEPERRIAGLQAAAAKWGQGTELEVVNLPPPGESRIKVVGSARPIVDIHAEIRALNRIGEQLERTAREALAPEHPTAKARRRDDLTR